MVDGDVDINLQPEAEPGAEPAQECPFCLIAEGKIPTNMVYDDGRFFGILDINPANPGHILFFPRFHYASLTEMGDEAVSQFFLIAKKLCDVLVKTFKAPGFNILVANGRVAGQSLPHVAIHLIPRYDNDNVSFAWKPKPISEDDMKKIADTLKSFPVDEKPEQPVYYEFDEDERIA